MRWRVLSGLVLCGALAVLSIMVGAAEQSRPISGSPGLPLADPRASGALLNPNRFPQDHALLISSKGSQFAQAMSVPESSPAITAFAPLTIVTNRFPVPGADVGSFLLHEQVGAADPSSATNAIPLPGVPGAVDTIGTPEQWHFYVFTNDTPYSNAVFLTFFAQPRAPILVDPNSPGAGTNQIWTPGVDVDLYVSTDSGLTNLEPAAVVAADRSVKRSGSEMILYSNATPGVFYVGVKCESIRGADYGFLADMSEQPFAQTDDQGNELLRGFPSPAVTDVGAGQGPAQTLVFHVTPDSFAVHRVIVTNVLSYSRLQDFQLSLTHDESTTLLHNHSAHGSPLDPLFVYEDSAQADLPGSLRSDGPGSLVQFSGEDAWGAWLLGVSTTNQPVTEVGSSIFLERQLDLAGTFTASLLPGTCRSDYIFVSPQATNLTATASLTSGNGPVSLQVFPQSTSPSNCISVFATPASPEAVLTVDQTSNPPLKPGQYIVRTCNLGADTADITLQANVIQGEISLVTNVYTSSEVLLLSDAAVTASKLEVTNRDPFLSAEVSVRIAHPRVSDLTLSLVSPDGQRALLAEGRGGDSADGFGADVVRTNTTRVDFFGGPEAVTNTFETGEQSGAIEIEYDFFSAPDEMRVYYETNLLFDSGLVSFKGVTNLEYGPGDSTAFSIVMNEGGNTESNTAWHYTVTATDIQPLYLTFTENTNLTTIPIKFAPAPFTNQTVSPSDGSLESGIFYLPEESLNSLSGKSGQGTWTLEIWDSRTGATNPVPALLSWQLALAVPQSLPTPITLTHDIPVTNLVAPGQIQWYAIDVPAWVSFTTNSLLSSTAPVNLLFNASVPPTGTNGSDIALALGSTFGSWTLSTNAPARLVPGSRYYLGIQNLNPATVSAAFEVAFDVDQVINLDSQIPYFDSNLGPFNHADFYRYVVTTNAARVQFEVNGPTGDVTLLARKGLLPSLAHYDYLSANPGTNDELITVLSNSMPVPLAPGEWFLSVVNATGNPAEYMVMASEFTDPVTNILVSAPLITSDSVCFSWDSLPGIHYVVQGKVQVEDPAWTTLSPTITASDYTTSFCVPLPSNFSYFRVSEGLGLVPALPIIQSVSLTGSGTLLQWSAATNLQFTVQWTTSLAPAEWQSFPGRVTSSDGTFQFLDDGSQSGGLEPPRFYRLQQTP